MDEQVLIRKKNRRHSDEFKAHVIAQCGVRGISVREVAKANGLGDSLVHSWLVKDRANSSASLGKRPPAEFVQLPVSQTLPITAAPIHVEVSKGLLRMTIDWPESCAVSAAVWLRQVLA